MSVIPRTFYDCVNNWPLNKTNKNALASDLQDHVEKQLSDFYSLFEVHELDYTGININEIMNWYDCIAAGEKVPGFGR